MITTDVPYSHMISVVNIKRQEGESKNYPQTWYYTQDYIDQ